MKKRTFLKNMGLGVLSAPLAGAGIAATTPNSNQALRVGLLLPQSSIIPNLGESVQRGMQLLFASDNQPQLDIFTANIGNGGAKTTQDQLQYLLAQKLDVVIGVVNATVTESLKAIIEEQQTPFIEIGIGARMPNAAAQSDYIFRITCNHWQNNFVTGQLALEQYGAKGLICTSLYDSGYDTVYSFRRGLESSGGEVDNTFVINDLQGMPDLVAGIKTRQPDFVYALFSGKSASTFLYEYKKAGLFGKIPLIGNRFLANDETLQTLGDELSQVSYLFPWSPNLNNTINQSFVESYQATNRNIPNEFSLLGYECAQLLAINAAALKKNSKTILLKSLQNTQWDSPRGAVHFNEYQQLNGPIYVHQPLAKQPAVASTVTAIAPSTLADCESCIREELMEIRSGWQNAYLAV